MHDLATQWNQNYPCKTKTSQEPAGNQRTFLEPEENPKVIYTDNSLEFGKLVKIFKRIIVRLHLVVLTQMELQKEQQEE